jgi:putative methionine-R-sulfoxide reductase with GAF domain
MAAIVQGPRPHSSNRRVRVRQKVHVPAYATFSGLSALKSHDLCEVLDISESGVALQCAAEMHVDQTVDLCLALAESGGDIPALARVAWLNATGRVGFHLSIPDDSALSRFREWLLLNAIAAAANAQPIELRAKDSDSPARRQSYTDALSLATAVQREVESLGSDLEAALALIAIRAHSLLRSSGAAIALTGKDADTMICRASAGETAPPVGVTLQVGSGFSGKCVRTGKLLRCDDAETDARVDRESCRALGIRSILAAPVRNSGKSVGLIEVFSSGPAAYGENDSAVLQRFADAVLAALNRAMRAHTPPPAPKPFSAPLGSVLFASAPEEPIEKAQEQQKDKNRDRRDDKDRDDKEESGAAFYGDTIGGIRLPRTHLLLLIAAAATIFLALGFLSAPWIQPWIQRKLQGHTPSVEQTVLASSISGEDASTSPVSSASAVDSATLPELRQLAAHGDADAENALGLLYSAGDDKQGIQRDEREAAHWFTKAAEHGSVPAQSKLGSLYWGGRGLTKDDNRAYFWTVLARASGDAASKVLAPFIAARLTLPQRAAIEQQAEQWLQQHETRAQAQNVR